MAAARFKLPEAKAADRVAAYVCDRARPPAVAKVRAPRRARKPLAVSVRSCSACGSDHGRVNLYGWRLARDEADLARLVAEAWGLPDEPPEDAAADEERPAVAVRADRIAAILGDNGGSISMDDLGRRLDCSRFPIQEAVTYERDRERRFTSQYGRVRLAGNRKLSPRERDADRIFAALRAYGPATRNELAERLGIAPTMISKAASFEADRESPRFRSDRKPRGARYRLRGSEDEAAAAG